MWNLAWEPLEKTEEDKDLRGRLLYVAGESQRSVSEIENASGLQLDELAARYGLTRR